MENKKDNIKGFIHNCEIILSNKEPVSKDALFNVREDGSIIACLDGYAIIPLEEYHELKQQSKI